MFNFRSVEAKKRPRALMREARATRADAFGERLSFSFRFSRQKGGNIRSDIVTYNKFVEPIVEEPVLVISANGDNVCRAFCFGIRELKRAASAEEYDKAYSHPFPSEALTALCETLGGEFADGGG